MHVCCKGMCARVAADECVRADKKHVSVAMWRAARVCMCPICVRGHGVCVCCIWRVSGQCVCTANVCARVYGVRVGMVSVRGQCTRVRGQCVYARGQCVCVA